MKCEEFIIIMNYSNHSIINMPHFQTKTSHRYYGIYSWVSCYLSTGLDWQFITYSLISYMYVVANGPDFPLSSLKWTTNVTLWSFYESSLHFFQICSLIWRYYAKSFVPNSWNSRVIKSLCWIKFASSLRYNPGSRTHDVLRKKRGILVFSCPLPI